MKKDDDEILDAAGVAKLLSMKKPTVYRLALLGVMPSFKPPRTRIRRFSKKEVLAWMESGKMGGINH